MTTKSEQQAEALGRAAGGLSTANYAAILEGFADRGINDRVPSWGTGRRYHLTSAR